MRLLAAAFLLEILSLHGFCVLAANDGTKLKAPPLPNLLPDTTLTIAVPFQQYSLHLGPSTRRKGGAFFGFSIEMSDLRSIVGKNSSEINFPFLHLIANIAERAGSVPLRWGGQTQARARLVNLEQTKETHEESGGKNDIYSMNMLTMMVNIAAVVKAKFYLGIPSATVGSSRLNIVECAQKMGPTVLGVQAWDEPDTYGISERVLPRNPPLNRGLGHHSNVTIPLGTADTCRDRLHLLLQDIGQNPNLLASNAKVVVPIVAPHSSGTSSEEADSWRSYILRHKDTQDSVSSFSVQAYPDSNCPGEGSLKTPDIDLQTKFNGWLTHSIVLHFADRFNNITEATRWYGNGPQKDLIMLETNTAACGGFPGISNSFGSALWMADSGFQLASRGFHSAMIKVGLDHDSYSSPFSPPAPASSQYVDSDKWSVGSVYYSALILAEVLGESTGSYRIVDLQHTKGYNGLMTSYSPLTPAYAIYDGFELTKFALFNYMDPGNDHSSIRANHTTDATARESGADLVIHLQIPRPQDYSRGHPRPRQVYVKYLESTSVATDVGSGVIYWGGQTMGRAGQSNGRLVSGNPTQVVYETVECVLSAASTSAGITKLADWQDSERYDTCTIRLPAPGFAMVFLNKYDPGLRLDQAKFRSPAGYGPEFKVGTYGPDTMRMTITKPPPTLLLKVALWFWGGVLWLFGL